MVPAPVVSELAAVAEPAAARSKRRRSREERAASAREALWTSKHLA
jgi:hypothetical protein